MFLKIWRRIEAGALSYFADQLVANKDAVVAELNAVVPEGQATLDDFNKAIESHVSPLARGFLDVILKKEEQAGEDFAVHDAPAFIDKIAAEVKAEAEKLLAEA